MQRKNLHEKPLSAPVNVTWEITNKCNLSCMHCLSADQRGACAKDMTLKECQGFIDDLSKIRVFQVNIGGGEPFLREDMLDILEYAHQIGMVTCVSTNGTMVDDSLAKKLAEMELLYIQVSLDGATAQTNDLIRGEGSFDAAIHGIENLNKYHFPHLSINTVVTGKNFQEIKDMYLLGKEYRAKTRLSRFRPSGSAKKVWQDYHLNKEQTRELAEILSKHKDVLTGDSFFSITAEDRKHLGLNMCGAAKMTCSVAPNGDVYPCAFLQEEEFLSGNILHQSLGEIWLQAPVFKMMRNLSIESCKKCTRFDFCHGGCPAIAFFLKNSLHDPDPVCIYNI
ncbi:MAG: mycofactocin radical SAM maturase [Dehalobacterium sp.]